MNSLTLNLTPIIKLTEAEFTKLAVGNPDLRIERKASGELIIMPPTGGETGEQNSTLNAQLWLWNQHTKLGKVFDSSTGFRLSNGAIRSPDVSWLKLDRWQSLTPQQRKKFLPLCPDFAIELMSPSDELLETQQKMQEYLDNGLSLGWLINPVTQLVEIYHPHQPVTVLIAPTSLSNEAILPGFLLDLTLIWAS